MNYSEWLNNWLYNYVKPTVKVRTFVIYKSIVQERVIPYFGACEMEELSASKVQEYIAYLQQNGNRKAAGGLSANYIHMIINVLKLSLELAVELGFVTKNVIKFIKRPKIKERPISSFSVIEQKTIEQYILQSNKDNLLGILLCFYTGIRLGELLALKWEDIDFQKEIIKIQRTCFYIKTNSNLYERIEDAPKTISSCREIPVPCKIFVLLKKAYERSISTYVISKKGIPISNRVYQKAFEVVLKKTGVQHRGFHAIRHTFATRALECGVDIKTLAEILGHKNPTITLNRYAHVFYEHKKEMMNKLNLVFEQ